MSKAILGDIANETDFCTNDEIVLEEIIDMVKGDNLLLIVDYDGALKNYASHYSTIYYTNDYDKVVEKELHEFANVRMEEALSGVKMLSEAFIIISGVDCISFNIKPIIGRSKLGHTHVIAKSFGKPKTFSNWYYDNVLFLKETCGEKIKIKLCG